MEGDEHHKGSPTMVYNKENKSKPNVEITGRI